MATKTILTIFSRKNTNVSNSALYFHKNYGVGYLYQKHLGAYLDKKLSFQHHIKETISKASKGIVLLKSWTMFLQETLYEVFSNIFKSPYGLRR